MVAACILAPEGAWLTPRDIARFRDLDPWGFILFARNVDSPRQLAGLTASLREAVGRDCAILVDQEGGRVQRLRAPHWREWPPPLDEVARAGEAAARVMHLRYALIGAELRAAGIDVDCAPCCDVAGPGTHPFLRNRCYGEDPSLVARIGRAVVEGLAAGGCLAVMKHMPGHGAARTDSHEAVPVVPDPPEVVRARDFHPFAALSDLAIGMTGHIAYPAFDAQVPATQSATMIGMIRDEIGFDGLLLTDDLSMGALHGRLGERAAASLAAGCDLALYCKGVPAECEEVVAAAGTLEGAALARADRALARRPAGPVIDEEAALDEYLALVQASG